MMAVIEKCSVLSSEGKRSRKEYVDERDGEMNEFDKFSTTRVTRPVLPDSGVVWKGIWWKDLA